MSSGLFIVPLYAYMQQRSDAREKGRVVATNNFYQTIGMLIAQRRYVALLRPPPRRAPPPSCSPSASPLLLVTVYIVTVVPDYLIRFVLWLLTHTSSASASSARKTCPSADPRCWSPTTCRTSMAS